MLELHGPGLPRSFDDRVEAKYFDPGLSRFHSNVGSYLAGSYIFRVHFRMTMPAHGCKPVLYESTLCHVLSKPRNRASLALPCFGRTLPVIEHSSSASCSAPRKALKEGLCLEFQTGVSCIDPQVFVDEKRFPGGV